jgi:alpha-glucosidase (family GH31 glycosyl hydrolase)
VQSSRYMQFDLAASAPDRWTLEADLGDDPALCLQWFTGGEPLDLIGRFAQQTGPVALPPAWAFGLWMSGNEWNTQRRIEQEVQTSLDLGIPPSVVVIEAWSDETTFYIWNDAQYTPRPGDQAFRYTDFTFPPEGKWPDPKAMVDWLHGHEVRLLLWQIPVIKVLEQPHAQHEADRAHVEQHQLVVQNADGTPHQIRPFWFRGGYLWDVTKPEARDWWLNKRAYLLDDLGIDGFKTDGGEHLWGSEVRFADGRRGDELWNEYPRHYSEAYYSFARSKRDGLTFSRAGYTGSQRSPMHWAGDEHSTWEAFRHSILAGLSAGIAGIPFWGWDIGGFSGAIPSAELYLRSAAMAVFCPVMQYHSEYNAHRQPSHDRTPWNIAERSGDPRVVSIFRALVNMRRNLMPYIWQEAQHAAQTGQPMMRALRLSDSRASDYQYYFGRDLLVCPVVEPDLTVIQVYLPAGRWFSLWDRAVYEGGKTLTIAAPLEQLPVFVREGAAIPLRLEGGAALGAPVSFSTDPDAIWHFVL